MSRPSAYDRAIDGTTLHVLLALALGRPIEVSGSDWDELLSLAVRERIAGVIWSRSAALIRRQAPTEVASRWKRSAIVLGLHAERQLAELAAIVAAFSAHDIPTVVLKGAPLAQRLYGDYTVRPTLDSDLYVDVDHREAAARQLGELGWRRVTGQWPEEEKFERRIGDRIFVLEVHSSVIDDAPLDHLRIPVEHETVRLGAYELPAHSGRLLPAFLAVHLLKHHEKPLLWMLDFTTLWHSLDDTARTEAVAAARQIGMHRHLGWAVRLSSQVLAVGSSGPGVQPAARRVQRALAVKSDLGRVMQLIALSSSPWSACRVVGGRVWPGAWRGSWRHAPSYFAGRAIRWAYRHLVFESPALWDREPDSECQLSLAEADCVDRLGVELTASRAVWVSSIGENMAPAVPSFASAHLIPLGARRLQVGDVVLVRRATRHCTLERVTSLSDDVLTVKPDAHLTRESRVRRDAVLAVCDSVRVGGNRIPIDRRPYGNAAIVRAILHSRSPFRAATSVLHF